MSERDRKLHEVVELTSAYVDERLDADQAARLESLLFGDPEACELYLNLTTLHAHLTRELGGDVPVKLEPQGVPAAGPPASVARSGLGRGGAWRYARYAAAACVLLVVGVASVLAVRASIGPSNACATLVELRDVVWAECSVPRQQGERLAPQTIGLTQGTAVIRFDGGAVATLSGPVEMLIESRKTADLRSGTVLVRAEKDAAGFTLRTAASDFVDLGTEFGVAINPDESSEVHVFEGVVIARPRASDLVVPVLGNEAGRVEAERGDVVAIEADAKRFTGVMTASAAARPAPGAGARIHGPLPNDARVVFIGDRSTDYETHLLLVDQSLETLHGSDRPRLYNAAFTMPLAFSEAELRKYVLSLRPTHAVLEFGPQIASGASRRPVDRFESQMRALIDRLLQEGIEPIVVTGFPLGERQAMCQGLLDDYNKVLRRLAADRGCRLADVDAHFRSIAKYKLSLVAPNGAAPTFSGYREIATALLASFGHPGTPVDPTLRVSLLPGVLTQWKYRLKPAGERLDRARAVADGEEALSAAPSHNWLDLSLPQPDDKLCSRMPDATHAFNFRDRSRGFATDLCEGKDRIVEAVTVVESSEDGAAFLNTGAAIRSVWLNGEKVYDGQGRPTGWHAGTERIPVSLRAGRNHLVVEAGGSFFLSLTDAYDWSVR